MMKRIGVLLLCLCMTFLCACSNAEASSVGQAAASGTSDLPEEVIPQNPLLITKDNTFEMNEDVITQGYRFRVISARKSKNMAPFEVDDLTMWGMENETPDANGTRTGDQHDFLFIEIEIENVTEEDKTFTLGTIGPCVRGANKRAEGIGREMRAYKPAQRSAESSKYYYYRFEPGKTEKLIFLFVPESQYLDGRDIYLTLDTTGSSKMFFGDDDNGIRFVKLKIDNREAEA